jgi:hypothetical protein
MKQVLYLSVAIFMLTSVANAQSGMRSVEEVGQQPNTVSRDGSDRDDEGIVSQRQEGTMGSNWSHGPHGQVIFGTGNSPGNSWRIDNGGNLRLNCVQVGGQILCN